MASFNNNWLGFSLSSHHQDQELYDDHSHNSVSELGFNSSFDLTSHSTIPIFQPFTTNPHSQDNWENNNMEEVSSSSFSCTSSQQINEEAPKLENFLGVDNEECCNNGGNDNYTTYGSSNNMGLSTIKNCLRNHPVPPHEAAPPQGAGGTQTLSLSMSTGSQISSDHNKLQTGLVDDNNQKINTLIGQRTSIYRGVTRHRWTGRYEAHLWDNSCRREGQTRKGRQVYLGGYDKEEKAARAYDLASLKYWGTNTTTNSPISNYEKELEEMKHMTRQEFVASLRRKSSGFSRGASIYRGVTRHHQHGRWQARIGRVAGNKDLYLGTFSTQEEAAEAYDIAAIKFRGLNAVTNFEINRYDVKTILESSSLPIGGGAKENTHMALQMQRANEHDTDGEYGMMMRSSSSSSSSIHGWPNVAFQALPMSLYSTFSGHQRMWCKQDREYSDGFYDVRCDDQVRVGDVPSNFLQNYVMVDSGQCSGLDGYEGVLGSSSLSIDDNTSFYDDQVISTIGNLDLIPSGAPNLAARVCRGGSSTFGAWNDE